MTLSTCLPTIHVFFFTTGVTYSFWHILSPTSNDNPQLTSPTFSVLGIACEARKL